MTRKPFGHLASSPAGVTMLSIIVLVFGLILWLAWFWSIEPWSYQRYRDFWLDTSIFGMSVWLAFFLTNLLLTSLAVASAIVALWAQRAASAGIVVCYAVCILVLLAINWFLYRLPSIEPGIPPVWSLA